MTAVGPLLVVLGILMGARAAGERLLRDLPPRLHPATSVALETTLGLLCLSWAVLGLALLGAATPAALAVAWALTTMAGVADLLLAAPGRLGTSRVPTEATPAGRTRALLGGLLAAWVAWIVAASTLPPTAIDELVYQLEIPRRTLELGRLPALADNIYGHFPHAGGMLFALGMAVAGAGAAKLIHGAAGLLTALALYGSTRRLAPDAPAWVAAAAFLGAPTVLVLGGWAYVDLLFTLFLLLALRCALETLEEDADRRWTFLAGVLAGGAWAVKYTGLQASLLLALVLLVDGLRRRRGDFPRAAVAVPAVAFLVACPWLLRNWWVTGWPLFPFPLPGFELVAGINWDPERARLYVRWLSQYGGGPERDLLERALSPLLVFVTARFDGGAFDGMAGPVFLMAPLLWVGRRPGRRLVAVWLFVLAYLLYWTLTTTQVRFLVPVLAPLALLLAAGLGGGRRRWARWLLVPLLLVGPAFGLAEVASWEPGRVWWGGQERQAWVERRVPVASVYRATEEMLAPDDTVYLVNMLHLGYLLERPPARLGEAQRAGWRSDYVFQHYRLGEALATGSTDAVRRLLEEDGVTHLLLDERLTLAALGEAERRTLSQYLRRHGRRLVPDPDQPHRALWALEPGPG